MNKMRNSLQAVLTTEHILLSKTALENPEGIHGLKMLILLRGLRLQTTTALTSRAYEF